MGPALSRLSGGDQATKKLKAGGWGWMSASGVGERQQTRSSVTVGQTGPGQATAQRSTKKTVPPDKLPPPPHPSEEAACILLLLPSPLGIVRVKGVPPPGRAPPGLTVYYSRQVALPGRNKHDVLDVLCIGNANSQLSCQSAGCSGTIKIHSVCTLMNQFIPVYAGAEETKT